MEENHPILVEYQKTIESKIDQLTHSIKNLKENYTINNLESLKKELNRLGNSAEPYGYVNASRLCQEFEWDIISKIKNFYLTQPPPKWFEDLSDIPGKLREAFKNQALENVTKTRPPPVLEKREKRKRIVVVDDDEDILKLLNYEYHEIGFETNNFKTGQEALDFLMNEENLRDVFLLVLDRMLPDMDGLDILQQFMSKSRIKVPVLILSALHSESDIIAGLQVGAIDYITKPFSIFILMQKTLNLLKSQT